MAAFGAAVSIAAVAKVQIRDVPQVLREFNELDALIPPHCTVAPVLSQFKLDPSNSAQLVYHPMFHAANRLELRNDRPVLFSYVARLPVYPAASSRARTRRGCCSDGRRISGIHASILLISPRFEASSGLPVDYVLLWDIPAAKEAGTYAALREAVSMAGYQTICRSSGGRMELLRRPGAATCGIR